MTGPYQAEPTLTAEQKAVVDLPVDSLLVVTAGAGAGKTHTMVRRLVRILAEGVPAHEVLVLSFARSAVRELRDRLARSGSAGRLVQVRTFDSWALDLLMDVDGNRDWNKEPFDKRIRAAAARIEDGSADERLGDLRHVVIDEAQDIVAERLELVKALIDRFNCSFTIVGDPAQSIYSFQIKSPEGRIRGANAFFDWLRDRFGGDLTELRLTQNFRARTAEARIALAHGPALRTAATTEPNRRGSYEQLRTTLMCAILLGELTDEFVQAELRDGPGTTAILCRTNGEALVISEQLAEGNVPHRLQRRAHDRVAPAWIAALFRADPGPVMTSAAFETFLTVVSPSRHTDALLIWSLLVRTAGDRGGRSVDMRRLRRAVAEKRLPDELTAQPSADLIVSTFHRAKGLEFDRVVVMDPGPLRDDQAESEAEEARLLYVAMTRPREELMRVGPQRSWRIRRDDRIGRYARFGRKAWQRFGIEVGSEDVHRDDPAGSGARSQAEPVALQEYMMSSVAPGDPIVLERMSPQSVESGRSPRYLVVHDGTPIGTASDTFRDALFRARGGRKGYEPTSYPLRITEIWTDAIETVTGSVASGAMAGLGEHGIWLAPRLVGLSRFELDRKGDDA